MIDIDKVVFVNIAPMKEYCGHEGVIPKSGGTYWSKYGYGHEMFNFLGDDGYCYGYSPRGISATKISNEIHEDEKGAFIDNVLVIFTSTGLNGRCITGFYVGARIYQKPIESISANRHFDNRTLKYGLFTPFDGSIGYEMVCKFGNAHLIPETQRNFKVPNARENDKVGFGQFPVWYANKTKDLPYKKAAIAYIQKIISAGDDIDDRKLQKDVDKLIIENHVIKDNSGYTSRFGDEATKPRKANSSENNSDSKYLRDPRKSWQAVKDADYFCEIDTMHSTFKRKDGLRNYTEAHHLIPLKNQDDFVDVDLDNPANIVSLCSNCHNWIHYGDEAQMLIEKLYNSRKKRLRTAGLDMSLEELLILQ